MLVALANTARDYSWGSTTLLAELTGRAPSEHPEAEIWFGDHPGSPARTPDGRTLDRWLAEERGGERLPYLLKLLAAGAPLSIQAHPSKAQAEAGFAREERAGVPRDAPDRLFRDANHKPELIVALADGFTALAGLRDLDRTDDLLRALGSDTRELRQRLAASPVAAIAWILSPPAKPHVRALVSAVRDADVPGFAAELAQVVALAEDHPGDPGVIVALLMNRVTLRRGEGLFVPAGVLHAYQHGLGVELMAASDNVMRGGITPKHIDVDALVDVLDDRVGEVPIVRAVGDGPVRRYPVPVDDFALAVCRVTADAPAAVPISGTAVVLATAGAVTVTAVASGASLALRPADAALVTAEEGELTIAGDGEAFIATPGP